MSAHTRRLIRTDQNPQLLLGSKRNNCMYAGKIFEHEFCPFDFSYQPTTHLPCDKSINQLYLINFIVHFIAFLRLPIVFNLDTMELFYDDCRLLVTLETVWIEIRSLSCVCVCVSVCLSFCACTHICLSSH